MLVVLGPVSGLTAPSKIVPLVPNFINLGLSDSRMDFLSKEPQTKVKTEITCTQQDLWLNGSDILLGKSQFCAEGFVYSMTEDFREKLMVSLALGQSRNDQDVIDAYGFSESSVRAVVKARILPWLKTTLVYNRENPADESDPYQFTAGYLNLTPKGWLPFDFTGGVEVDSSSTLGIGYIKKNIGSPYQGDYSASIYAGGAVFDQEFRGGTQRQDTRPFAALQLNLNSLDQSMIVGVGQEIDGGPTSHLIGFHGSLLNNRANQWLTVCRVRKSRDAQQEVRATQFCIVQIALGYRGSQARGRYIDLLGSFAPGMVKPTRIVGGSTLSENENQSSTELITERPKWEFVASSTDVEITDDVKLRMSSVEFYRSFSESFNGLRDPYIGTVFSRNNNIFFDTQTYRLKNTKPSKELSLAAGAAIGSHRAPWASEVTVGWDLRNHEPIFSLIIQKLFD